MNKRGSWWVMSGQQRKRAFEAVKAAVRAMEGAGRGERASAGAEDRQASGRVALGAAPFDKALAGGLGPGLHEISASAYFDAPALGLFLAGVCTCAGSVRAGPLVWVRARRNGAHDFGPPDPGGLAGAGVAVDRLLFIDAPDARAALWALEEAARTPGLGVLIGELGDAAAVDFTALRRLHLAAGAGGNPLLLARAGRARVAAPGVTRWRVGAAPSVAAPWRGAGPLADLGRPRLELVLERAHGLAAPLVHTVEWRHDTHSFCLAAAMADRPVHTSRPAPDCRPERPRPLRWA